MIKSKRFWLSLLIIILVLIISSCEILEMFDDEYLEETIIPEYAWQLYGNKIVFSPDGYGNLSSVDYTFINDNDVVGNNSDNVSYSGITWDI
ncbi:MAG: hypothetical protein JEZ04_09570 [Spirochaetales bacterium]|nr:hypothetical protein [Spirochaetales bacterium]